MHKWGLMDIDVLDCMVDSTLVTLMVHQVLVDRCKIRYSPKKQAVVVSLHKYSTMPWRFLKQ
jgi:hypothetical protein